MQTLPFSEQVEAVRVLSGKQRGALITDGSVYEDRQLIPQEALDEVEAAKREEPEKEEGKQKEDAGRKSAFTFDNPTGDNIFLPVSANSGDGENCLIYTVAYETDGTRKIELLYEVVSG